MVARERLALCLLCLAMARTPGGAQVPGGSISGSVRDQSGGLMPDVTITLVNSNTGLERRTVTSADGTFDAAALAAGPYTVNAAAPGFRTLVENVIVQVGQITTLTFVMQVGEANQIVNVSGEAPLIDHNSHTIAGVVTRESIAHLPLNGRSFLQLSSLAPGVTTTPNPIGQANRQMNVNVLGAGSKAGSVRITVDGATIADPVSGGTQQNFSQDVVQEFQLSSLNFDLSTGVGAGGVINIVTRSGGNDFHGSGFFFFRDHNMAAYPYLARDPHEPASPFFARRQTGYQAGGPIKKERLFFFSSLEYTNQTGVFSAYPSDPAFAAFAVNASGPFHENELTERLDFRATTRHTAFLRYSHDGNDSYAPSVVGGLPSDWNANRNYADSGVFSLISVLSPSATNEFRDSMTYWSNTNNPPTSAECSLPCPGLGLPNIHVRGVTGLVIGNAANAPQSRALRRYMFADNLSKRQGRHVMKFGGSWEHQQGVGTYASAAPANTVLSSPENVRAFNAQQAPGLRIPIPSSFNSVDDLLQLPVFSFTMGVGDISSPSLWRQGQATHNDYFHIYWQDNWRIHPRFSLNYGLAWSYESNALNYDLTKPEYLAPIFGGNGLGKERHAPHNFSPMLGFAWTATSDHKTVVRGGAGIYYDTINSVRVNERAMLGPPGTGRLLMGDSFFFPKGIPATFTGAKLVKLLPAFYSSAQHFLESAGEASPEIRNINVAKTGTDLLATDFGLPYSEQASIGVQREISSDFVISADFVFRQYLHQMIRDTDLNHYYSGAGPVIPKCQGNQASDPSADCSKGVIQGILSGARSHYAALLVKADKRFSHRIMGTLAYAYVHNTGYNGLIDDSNWFASWGPQAGHQMLTGSVIVDLPKGFEVGGITSFVSATPFQPILTGVDLNDNGAVKAGEVGGAALPGGGYNEFGVDLGKSDLVRLVDQFNQNYAGKITTTGKIREITLPASFSFGRSFNSQDLRITKSIRLGTEHARLAIFAECFNLLNIANLSDYGASLNAPGFGAPTQRTSNIFGSGGPRAFQLGARATF